MQNESAIKFATEECNVEILTLSDEEQARWIELVEPVQEDFLKEMAALGLDGAEALEVAKKLSDKYNAVYK